MQILFPNPFGAPAPAEAELLALQAHIGFSDAYADFLRTQNGFSILAMEQSGDISAHTRPSPYQSEERHANLRALHSFAAQDPYYDLESEQAEFLLAHWFLNIGCDPAGNPFVEVLHGHHQGKIGSLDHDLFAGSESLQNFLTEMELSHITALSLAEQADALCDDALGLIWFHARDMNALTAHGIHCDAQFWGFVVDEPGL